MKDAMVTGRELADWLGLSERSVRDLASSGLIVRAARNRYPLRSSVASYAAHLREIAAGRISAGEESLDLVAERARLARAQAIRVERENEIAEGRLVEVDAVAAVLGSECATIRNRLLSIPRERAPLLHRCRSAAELEDALRETITEALEELTAGEGTGYGSTTDKSGGPRNGGARASTGRKAPRGRSKARRKGDKPSAR